MSTFKSIVFAACLLAACGGAYCSTDALAPESYFKKGGKKMSPICAKALEELNSPFGKDQMLAINTLVSNKETGAVPEIIKLFRSENIQVKRAAVNACGELGDKIAVDPLISMLKDKDDIVRFYAVNSLGAIKDRRAALPLVAALKDPNREVKASALKALGELGDPRVISALNDALRDIPVDKWTATAVVNKLAVSFAAELDGDAGSHRDGEDRWDPAIVSRENLDNISDILHSAVVTVDNKIGLIRRFGELGDPVVVARLSWFLNDPVIGKEIEQCFVKLGRSGIEPLKKQEGWYWFRPGWPEAFQRALVKMGDDTMADRVMGSPSYDPEMISSMEIYYQYQDTVRKEKVRKWLENVYLGAAGKTGTVNRIINYLSAKERLVLVNRAVIYMIGDRAGARYAAEKALKNIGDFGFLAEHAKAIRPALPAGEQARGELRKFSAADFDRPHPSLEPLLYAIKNMDFFAEAKKRSGTDTAALVYISNDGAMLDALRRKIAADPGYFAGPLAEALYADNQAVRDRACLLMNKLPPGVLREDELRKIKEYEAYFNLAFDVIKLLRSDSYMILVDIFNNIRDTEQVLELAKCVATPVTSLRMLEVLCATKHEVIPRKDDLVFHWLAETANEELAGDLLKQLMAMPEEWRAARIGPVKEAQVREAWNILHGFKKAQEEFLSGRMDEAMTTLAWELSSGDSFVPANALLFSDRLPGDFKVFMAETITDVFKNTFYDRSESLVDPPGTRDIYPVVFRSGFDHLRIIPNYVWYRKTIDEAVDADELTGTMP